MLRDLSKLTDNELLTRTKTLRNAEHESMIEILQDLIETERRKLDLDLGYSSLFDYCVNYLEYSASAAGRRIQAARCIHRFPVVLDMLANHELSLSTITQIEGILTDDNYKKILDRVRGASHRDVEKIACEYRPPMKFRDRVRPVCVAKQAAPASHEGARGAAHVEKKMLVQFLAGDDLVQKFEKVKALLSAGNLKITFAEVVEVMVDDYLERHSPEARQERREARRGSASSDSRRREWKNTRTRHVPDETRDAVFVRDGAQCTFVAADGTRCTSTHGLHIDHIKPFAAGGGHHHENLRLLCAAHNKRAAENTMGLNVMHSYWRRP